MLENSPFPVSKDLLSQRCGLYRDAQITAIPALPPEEGMNRVAPLHAYSWHAKPMPRILNEPGGCNASILSQTRPLVKQKGREIPEMGFQCAEGSCQESNLLL